MFAELKLKMKKLSINFNCGIVYNRFISVNVFPCQRSMFRLQYLVEKIAVSFLDGAPLVADVSALKLLGELVAVEFR